MKQLKKINTLLLVATAAAFLFSCSDKKGKGENTTTTKESRNMQLYHRAIEMGDLNSAIYALNQHLMDNEADTSSTRWYDTLAVLYLNNSNFMPASWSADKVLKVLPNDLRMLELKAMAEQNLGRKDKVLETYNKLFQLTKDYQYIYQTAAIEFSAGNVQRCQALVDEMMKSNIADDDSLDIQIDNDYSQKVPLKAAVYNLQAFLKARTGNYAGAKKDFETSLKIFPDFVLAKRNLQDMMGNKRPN